MSVVTVQKNVDTPRNLFLSPCLVSVPIVCGGADTFPEHFPSDGRSVFLVVAGLSSRSEGQSRVLVMLMIVHLLKYPQ